jgi:DNA integrity scanning protein DisA with diadenylate cyclase activity
MKTQQTGAQQLQGFPTKLGKPALRALAAAGYTQLEQLTAISVRDLSQLHGIGPHAIQQLRDALAAEGMAFAQDDTQRNR